MSIQGHLLIGRSQRAGRGHAFHAVDPATGETIEPMFASATEDEVAAAAALAQEAFRTYRALPLEVRARFLEAIADNIDGLGDHLIIRCMAETGLPRGRLEGERARTTGQLRLFASVVRDRDFLDIRIDPAQPERKPLPRPDLRLRKLPLGPVAVFGASNFPLAFSVAGGDTASALAAGCPVVVKAHPAHPGTSELVGRAVQAAVSQMELPEGVFSLLFDGGHDVGRALVSNPHIHAVGFTGSRSGGRALVKLAAERPVPIPIHAEMSSINPVLMFKAALRNRHRDIADRFVAALTLGAGQFCTNPGLVLAMEGPELDAFITATAEEVERAPASVMLTESIFRSYCSGVERLGQHPQVERVFGKRSSQGLSGLPSVFSTTAEAFLSDVALQEEVFGASALVVRCESNAALRSCVDVLEGQLTISMHMDAEDHAFASTLLPSLEEKAGRLLVNGFGTGVEVSPAMVHGGPYPATSDGRSTSVGTMAIDRFLRPICYQDFPGELLPEGLG